MTFEELKTKTTKQWDGYLTISKQTAKLISTTGKLPKEGYTVKSKINWPSQMGSVKNTNEKVWLEESEMWIGWTTYNNKRCLYIY